MRLENLYLNFGAADPVEQQAYMTVYRLRRAEDMAKPSTYKKKRTATTSKIDLSEEEKLLCKLLGLKQKDIIALRLANTDTVEDDPADLFKDPTYDEDEGVEGESSN